MNRALRIKYIGYVSAVLTVVLVSTVLVVLRDEVNQTTVALALLLVVLFIATFAGSRPALVASGLGMLCFNYFFLPPYGTLTIADPQNWIALTAFLVTAITAGQLSARARRRAEEAEIKQAEIERLYAEMQKAFDKASRAEALRQSERLKSALLDAVTHDIRTPLTSIKASVTTLLNERRKLHSLNSTEQSRLILDDEARDEMLEIIDEEADRLNRFLDGLIELARIEAGELQLRRRWGALDGIVQSALARASKLISAHRVEVNLQAELPLVRVDPRAVSEVIYTLLDNAAKYAPAGTKISITAERGGNLERSAAANDYCADEVEPVVLVAVEDEGRGIEVELRERVFDKFFRATQDGLLSLTDERGDYEPSGTGMGLAIAHGIVEAHGGRIWIEDTRGAGKEFEAKNNSSDSSRVAQGKARGTPRRLHLAGWR
ncbi:MAG: DUF4118 domain-containing protein [Pyrinomonadaceae bacterium]